jgi:micrococcal nuclease
MDLNLLKKITIFGFCLILLSACKSNQLNSNSIIGKVERVISGQSIEVVVAGKSDITKVRIIGIDAPDLRQSPWGEAAKQRLVELVMRSQIELEPDTIKGDRFERILAHVWHNKTLVSEQLVKEGYVLANTEYPHSYSKLLIDAQEYARLMGYGIWNPQQPMRQLPAQFRSQYTTK